MEENTQRDLGYIFPNKFQFIVKRADPSSRNEQPSSFPQTQLDTVSLSVLITSFVVQLCYGCAFESRQIRWYTPVAGVGIRSMFRITWVTWDKVYY